jgi:hypothetical protein
MGRPNSPAAWIRLPPKAAPHERRGQVGRAQTERLQAAAARGRIIDAEAERRRADRQP